MMKKIVLLSLAAMLCTIDMCAARKFRYAMPDGQINLISYNVRQSGAAKADGDNAWEFRRHATIEMMRREAPSVIGLQEAKIDQVQYIERNMPQYVRIGVGRDDGKDAGEMTAIFYLKSRFDLLGSGTFWLSETPDKVSRGWDAKYNRTVTWVHLREKSTGSEFYYFNGHLDHKGVLAREESMKLIARKALEIAGEDAAVIIGGDFNATADNPIYAPLLEISFLTRTAAPVTDNRPTSNAWGRHPGTVIDHLFARNIECLEYHTLDGDYGAPYISDHYPVQIIFRTK